MSATVATNRAAQQPLMVGALAVLLVAAVIWLAWSQLTRDDVLPMEEVQFSGEFLQLNQQELAQQVLPAVRGNFFTLDVDAIHQRVMGLPWVKRVWVDRIWPNTVRVRIEEQKAIAVWNAEGLMNADGDVFVQQAAAEKLLGLFGPETERMHVIEKLSLFSAQLDQAGLALQQLHVDERLAWKLVLDDGVRVVVGRENVERRLQRFVNVYRQYLASRKDKLDTVDMRYANGLAVKWKSAQKA